MQSIPERLSPEELIVFAGKYIFERGLTDTAGGNISIKVDGNIYMTPTMVGVNYHWLFDEDDVVIGSASDLEGLKKHPRISREGFSHLSIYASFPYIDAVVHAHPRYVAAYVAQCKPIPPIMRASEALGVLEYHEPAEAYSQDQADKIVKVLKKNEATMKKKAGVVLMPKHGVIIASQGLMIGLDVLERVNTNAFANLAQKLID